MMKRKARRSLFQAAFALVTNANVSGFFTGKIYQGQLKKVCVPGLNCYACPGALGSCPLGALQNGFNDPAKKISFYAAGLMALFGVAFGRLVCSRMCPFGLLQEILNAPAAFLARLKKPAFSRAKKKPSAFLGKLGSALRWAKVVILAVFVVILPLFALDEFGYGTPWFCKYICPSGTIGGALPLMLADSRLAGMRGALFWLKVSIASFVALGSVVSHRFFCKHLCPLGAFYGFFNKISFYRMSCNGNCNDCGTCKEVCKMGVNPRVTPNSPECIRCGDCIEACPCKALKAGWEIETAK